MTAFQVPFSYGNFQFIHRQPTRPYRLVISESCCNSSDAELQPRKRYRLPSFETGSYEPNSAAQMGRLFLEVDGTPEPYGDYRILMKTRVFHRFNRNHVGEDQGDRELNLFGWGTCRAKEHNGQLIGSDMILVPKPKEHEFVAHYVPDDEECNYADYNRDTTAYRNCEIAISTDRYLIGTKSGDTFDAYARVSLGIPAGSTIVDANMTIISSSFIDVVPFDIQLLDGVNLDPFDTTDATTHSIAHTTAQYDLLGYGNNKVHIIPEYCDTNDDPESPNGIPELIQAAIDQAGYAEDDYVCFKFRTKDEFLDATPIGSDQRLTMFKLVISVRYRDPDYVEGTLPSGPPVWQAYERMDQEVALLSVYGPEMEEGGGDYVRREVNFTKFASSLPGTDYEWVWFAPVPPIDSWYDEEDHGPTPLYGENAHNAPFPFNECGTYEIACRRTTHPFGYVGLNKDNASVYPGLRACVGHSDLPPKPGVEEIYATGCGDALGETYGMIESTVRSYEAQTAKVRHWYSQEKGWYIDYTIYVTAMFVYGDERDFLHMPYGESSDSYGSFERWNCWYKGCVVADWRGPDKILEPTDYALFVGWVNTKENKFGGTFKPKVTGQCNDIMLRCAGNIDAMGDTLRPSEADQDDCLDSMDLVRQLPCVEEGRYSYWYLPNDGSNHPYTPSGGPVIPQKPEYGLMHEFERTVYTDPEQTTTETDEGWMQIGFQSNRPVIRGVSVLDPFPRNQVIDMTPFTPTGAQAIPDGGSFLQLEFEDSDGWVLGDGIPVTWTTLIGVDVDTEPEMQAVCDALFGTGNAIAILKSSSPYYVWTIEFTGDLAQRDVAAAISANYGVSYLSPDEYEYTHVVTTTPKGGGLTE